MKVDGSFLPSTSSLPTRIVRGLATPSSIRRSIVASNKLPSKIIYPQFALESASDLLALRKTQLSELTLTFET